jgi:hypothetical protein
MLIGQRLRNLFRGGSSINLKEATKKHGNGQEEYFLERESGLTTNFDLENKIFLSLC